MVDEVDGHCGQGRGHNGMKAVEVATDELRALAGQLARGRVFASGRAFVPFVKAGVFDQLAAQAANAPRPMQLIATEAEGDDAKCARSWSEVAVGSLVLASDGPAEGWREALVVEAHAEDVFTLKWRDFPDDPPLLRRRQHIGLLHPGEAAA